MGAHQHHPSGLCAAQVGAYTDRVASNQAMLKLREVIMPDAHLREGTETRVDAVGGRRVRLEEGLDVRTGTRDGPLASFAQAHGRAMETAIGNGKAESRRMITDHEGEMQRQCDTLGRAIHSLADTLNLTSPLIAVSGSPQR